VKRVERWCRLGFVLIGLPLAGAAIAQDLSGLIARAAPAVVTIASEDAEQGSGFVVSADGRIVTNLHVIARMKRPRVTLATGETFDRIRVLIYDPQRDLAVLKIPAEGLRMLPLGDSSRLRVGQRVLAIGAPRGLAGTTTTGIVSAIRAHPKLAGATLLQTDAAINFGSSGGPLVNAKGEAVGVVASLIRDAHNLSFAVPANDVRALLKAIDGSFTIDDVRAYLLHTDWAPVVLARRWRADSDFYLGRSGGAVYELSGADAALELRFQRPAAEAQLGARLVVSLQREGASYHGHSAGQLQCETLRESRRLPWSHAAAKITSLTLERIELTFFAPAPPDPGGGCELSYKQFGMALVPAAERDLPSATGETEYLEAIRKRRAAEQARREQLRRTCVEVRQELAGSCAKPTQWNATNCKIFGEIAANCALEGF
jgi:S1-C subfamily serine protease